MHADSEIDRPEAVIKDKGLSPDAALEEKELREIIFRELEGFSEEERNIIILREMQGLEYEEIKEVLKMPLGSIKSKLSRAREKLRKKLVSRLGEQ